MVETGNVLKQDTFTLTADAPRIEHCWLHDLVFWVVHKLLGVNGLSLLKGFLVAATALVLFAAARAGGASFLAILLLGIPTFLLSEWAWLDRPQLWSFLLFALFVFILERHRHTGDRLLFILLPLMILWSNLHAGAILAFPLLAAYLVGEGVAVFRKRSFGPDRAYKRLCGLMLLLAAASLVTPYGPHVLKTLLHASHLGKFSGVPAPSSLHNVDWKALSYAEYPIFYRAMGAALFVILLGWRRFALSQILLLAGLAFMGTRQARHIPLFFMGLAAFMPRYADAALQPLVIKLKVKSAHRLRGVGAAAAVGLIVMLVLPVYAHRGLFDLGICEWRFPIKAASFIEKHELPANLFNSYEWGGYLAWRLYPDYQVFWDARNTSKEMFALGRQITDAESSWQKALERYNVQTFVLMPCDLWRGRRFGIIARLVESPAYALVYADEFSAVFVKKDAVEKNWLQAHQLSKIRIYDTILSASTLLVTENPWRYMAYFEMFRVYYARREHRKALEALQIYLSRSPVRDPIGESVYQKLSLAVAQLERQ